MWWTRIAARGALVLVLVVVACVGGSGVVPHGAGRGPITLATGRDLTGYLQRVLDGWNAAHPAERVTLVQLPEAADEVHAQMADSLGSRSDRFDVLNIDVTWTAEFAEAGWIAPLDRDALPMDRLLPSVTSTATFRGRLYAMPYVTNAGLLYYRKDILDRAGVRPPTTWAELEQDARTLAPRYGLEGYAGQFLPYEGLTVNVAEALRAAGGAILADDGRTVTVDSAAARDGLDVLARGVREGWIPREALTFKEEESRAAFEDGRLLFLRNWPYVYDLASAEDSKVAGKFGAVPLPGAGGATSSVLGGSNLAVNSRSRHPRTAADLLAYLTSEGVQRKVLTLGSLPPVWVSLYHDPALIRRYPYLPVLERSVAGAAPRPKSPAYEQVSLAVAAVTSDVLRQQVPTSVALERLDQELRRIVGTG
ncbi:carbohydrate ABC transporter substrate-binding protein, CUT1 family [Actinacidiphila alni]|uniref:Carbohydrate ABC transporter substrate-binding protein, CUT1 family n=1 Tax=Actinacidiphila alni TaxID=380248 RepID=A0A1I2J041_9ACTN|nr:ABC transporter substrate-binding protein [Actinacidiphila alni]SFF47358.1 carbohydrate ABC transporter substrate-binding protein, CUT1 family [Actinacidiphila alni]